ncbi:ATP-binding protein [Flavobacterium sp. TR2]|uniref:tetratricopeptide repeat-containing sensor histidine kinase n=1 Tax=Flavobacterium sp. TR2 TaxID=2977321 RepID=UPI0021B0B8F9|nr:tetratricopeptide repeat-containing sensor histidine kinase [Flavobacterium sp. TR2]UWY28357.1 ATP-binding protein [Flavobacterium sp. TR2]
MKIPYLYSFMVSGIIYFWRMKPKGIQFSLYIILIFTLFFACQKRKNFTADTTNNKVEIEKNINAADSFYKNKKFDSAFYFYNRARTKCNPNEDAKSYVYCMYYMAEIQQDHEDFIGSTKTATETVPYLKKINDPNHVWNIYSVLGRNYYYTYDYPNAIYYYSKAFALKVDRINILEAKNNIATIYLDQGKYNKALQIFLSISKEKIVQEKPIYYAKVLDYIGLCYFKLKNGKALAFFEKSIQINSEAKNEDGLGKTYYNLAQYYHNNKSLAMMYAKLSYKNYTLSDNSNNRLLALKFIIENTNSPAEIKEKALLYIKENHRIYAFRQKAKNQFAKMKYDSKREKEENLKLKAQKIKNELQLEKQESKNIISYIIIILVSCLIVFVYYYLNARNNRQKIEAAYQSETRISKKLHDELANDIYHTLAFVENRNLSAEENRSHLLKKLDDIYSRTRDVSKENNPILGNQNFTISLKEMISGFNTPKINLLINGLDEISWNQLDEIKKTSVYRIIQELLVNMKKHSDATLVAITFKKRNNTIIINYTDNGKGIDSSKMVHKNGLHNIENRIRAIKGEVEIHSDFGKGFKLLIKFPV